MSVYPCILIPGIQGSTLENLVPIPRKDVWGVTEYLWNRKVRANTELRLDSVAEVDESPAMLARQGEPLSLAYGGFASDLLAYMQKNAVELGPDNRIQPCVFPFAYDWRYPVRKNAQRLVEFVKHLQRKNLACGDGTPGPDGKQWFAFDRTQPMQAHLRNKFNFVGHSMGGLVFRHFFAEWQADALAHGTQDAGLPVDLGVFVAVPHKGSLDAVDVLVRGKGGLFDTDHSFRKMARTFPGIYDLLPWQLTDPYAVQDANGEVDIYDVNNWQSNVFDDEPTFRSLVGDILQNARRDKEAMPDPVAAGMIDRGNLLTIYGDEPNTTIRSIGVGAKPAGVAGDPVTNWFDFDRAEATANLGSGDGVVPLESSTAIDTPRVQITKDDLHWSDVTANSDLHPFILNADSVRTVIGRFLTGGPQAQVLTLGMRVGAYTP